MGASAPYLKENKMPKRNVIGLTSNEQLDLMAKAMQGDIVLVIDPETSTPAPTAAAFDTTVGITFQTAAGEIHSWLNGTYATTASIADTSTAGTASIASTTLTVVNGYASVVVSGDAAAWLDTETWTLTIANVTIMGYTVTGGTSVATFTA
jgi:hypothetical protein